jgi:hypothetical protein
LEGEEGRSERKKERQVSVKGNAGRLEMMADGDVYCLMAFHYRDKCMRKWDFYGWAEGFKHACKIVGDAHSGLP